MRIKHAEHAMERVDQINAQIQNLLDQRAELLEYLSGIQYHINDRLNDPFVPGLV